MATLREERIDTWSTRRASRVMAGVVFTAVGIAVGLGIGEVFDIGDSPSASYSGSLVERSLSMDENINVLIEGGRAQARALTPVTVDSAGALVERSLAMEANVEVLIRGGEAQAKALEGGGTTYSGPLVAKSLAMERNLDALIEGGRAMGAALGR